ncbi:putative xylan 1,4-beta-xylosidase [Helianthus annuus]|nr:putative xylan 1,4-beta-xylosidase [Helianthus annuus]KAJ0786853.1 putative xylan 1,4-beta-xylosidase [Helianthus annuus]
MVQKPHIKCIIISPPSLFFILIGFLIVFTGKSRPPFACDPSNKVTKDLTFCRVNLPIKDRVKDLLGRLTLQEKISLLVNNAAAVPRLGIQGYEWWSEALHGVSDVGPGTKFLPTFLGATQFPQVITTASTFNDTLWEEIGQVMLRFLFHFFNERIYHFITNVIWLIVFELCQTIVSKLMLRITSMGNMT